MALVITRNTSVGEMFIENQLSSQKPTRMVLLSLEFDASYPAGGEPLTAADIGLKTIEQIHFNVARDDVAETARICAYDATAETVIVYEGSGAGVPFTEVTAADDLSDLDVECWAIGSV